MNRASAPHSKWLSGGVPAVLLATLIACTAEEKPDAPEDLTSFATRYAAAWSGKDPVAFGAFYDEAGSLIVNGSASVGRAAIVETARSYMAAFPDMVVRLDSLREESGATVFHWTWTGTNTGPGGTGKAVNLRGYERWTFGPDGLIMTSDGHFDNDEYQRQLTGESPAAAIPDLIELAAPLPDAIIQSPLILQGRARGVWFFEASFPAYLIDADGDTVAVMPVQAEGEWMTTEFVPFKATLTFTAPTSGTGTLILMKDNASGLPEHAAELRVPVRFR